MLFSVEFFLESSGRSPVEKFLKELLKKDRALWISLQAKIRKIKSKESHRMPLVEPIETGMFSLRAKGGNGIARILFTFRPGRRIVLLHAFQKKNRKIPKENILLARRRKIDLESREERK